MIYTGIWKHSFDIFDIGNLYKLLEGVRAGKVGIMDVYTEKPSPFSSELLFNFWQIYQYVYDLPVAERRNQLLVNDREFIQLAAGVNGEYELIDPRAVEAVESELSLYKYNRKIGDADELYHFIHSFGELACGPQTGNLFKEVGGDTLEGWLKELEGQGRIIRFSMGKAATEYWVAAEDYSLYGIAAGIEAVPADIAAESAVHLLRRYVLYTGPFTPSKVSEKYGTGEEILTGALERLVWSGVATNDSFSVARYYNEMERKNSPWTKYNTYPNMGRWYLAEKQALTRDEKRLFEHINRMLDRYGIISKDINACGSGAFKWSEIYNCLKASEFNSGIKRGFYVSGLSGIQFARDRELELIRLQEAPDAEESYVTLCSCDPANPYRDLFIKKNVPKLPKGHGTAIVFRNGVPVLAVRDFGSSMLPLVSEQDILVKAAQSFINSFSSRTIWTSRKNIFTENWGAAGDGDYKIHNSPLYSKLLEMGYESGYNGITLWRKMV